MPDNETRETLSENFPSNSKTQKAKVQPKAPPEEKKVEKVVTGTVKQKKRGFGKKLAENLLEDDTKSVGSYIFYDILIPAFKDLIFDTIRGGVEQALWGTSRRSKSSSVRRDGGRTYTSYDRVSYNSGRDRDRDRERGRDISRTSRARHNFDEITLESRGEAEEVLSHLVDLTIDYGMATVADLYGLVGIIPNFTDDKYGWYDLRDASISRVRGGYLINLPRTQPLD